MTDKRFPPGTQRIIFENGSVLTLTEDNERWKGARDMTDKPTIHDLSKCKDDFTDSTPIPFGKHKGTKCGDLPYEYLAWLYDQDWVADEWPKLFEYILDKMEEYGESDDEGWS